LRLPVAQQHVFVTLEGATADEVLGNMVARLAGTSGAPSTRGLLDAILARERLGTTAVGSGVAIPHAKLSDLGRPLLAVATTAQDIDFDAPDGKPVRLLFLALSPANAPAEHLRLLATISRWLAVKPSKTVALLAADSRARVLDILLEETA